MESDLSRDATRQTEFRSKRKRSKVTTLLGGTYPLQPAMGVVNSKLAQCPLLEKQDKNPRTVVNFRAYIVSKLVGQDIFVYSRVSPFPCLLVTFSILPQPPEFSTQSASLPHGGLLRGGGGSHIVCSS